MKIRLITLALLVFVSLGSADPYSLGDFMVSFDIGLPSTAVAAMPTYDSQRWAWSYQLNILPGNDSVADSNDSWQMVIGIDEYATSREAGALLNYANHRQEDKIASGIQNYRTAIVDYNGYTANIESYPHQTVQGPGGMISVFPESYQLCYMPDSETTITIASIGASKELFEKLITSLKIKEKDNSIYKESFVGKTSNWAGAGNGSIRKENGLPATDDELPSTPLGVGW